MTEESIHERHERLTRQLYADNEGLPARYVFVLTTRCNLRCSFCPQDKHPSARTLDASDWLNIAAQLPEYARVTITGGEPILSPVFREVMGWVGARFDCNVISNGTLLTPEIIDFLLSLPKFKVLSVSIDTKGNVNRDFPPARWDRLLQMLRLFVQRRDELGSQAALDVKTVVFNNNADKLFDLHTFMFEELGCDTHAFQFLKGSPLQHADTMYPLSDTFVASLAPVLEGFDVVTRQLEKVRLYSLETGSRVFMHPKFALFSSPMPLPDLSTYLNATYHDETLYEPCMFPWSSVHINEDGSLFPCQSIKVGNARTETLRHIVDGALMQEFRKIIREHGTTQACNRCGWLRLKNQKSEV